MVSEVIQHRLVKMAGKAFENLAVDVVGVTSQLVQSLIECGESAALLELDNVFVRYDVGAPGGDEGRRFRALARGRGSQCRGQDGEE